jgi:hypothetical protein
MPDQSQQLPKHSTLLYGIYAMIKYIIDRKTKAAWCRMRLCTIDRLRHSRMRLSKLPDIRLVIWNSSDTDITQGPEKKE